MLFRSSLSIDEHFPIYQRLSPALVCGNQLKTASNRKGRVLHDRRHLKGHRTAPLLHNIVDFNSEACMAYNIGIIHRQTDSVPLSATGEHSTAQLPESLCSMVRIWNVVIVVKSASSSIFSHIFTIFPHPSSSHSSFCHTFVTCLSPCIIHHQ